VPGLRLNTRYARYVRPLIAALFTAAVASTLLAGDGLVLVPHTHAPGAPAEHPHGLALYRFPIALLGEPADAPRAAADPTRTSFRMSTTPAETLVGASLLLLGAVVIVAIDVSRRRVRKTLSLFLAAQQWSIVAPTGPPRALPIA